MPLGGAAGYYAPWVATVDYEISMAIAIVCFLSFFAMEAFPEFGKLFLPFLHTLVAHALLLLLNTDVLTVLSNRFQENELILAFLLGFAMTCFAVYEGCKVLYPVEFARVTADITGEKQKEVTKKQM